MDPIDLRYDLTWSSDLDELDKKLSKAISLRAGLAILGVSIDVAADPAAPRSSLRARLPAVSIAGAIRLFRLLGFRNADLWLTCADAETIAATTGDLSWEDDVTGCGAVALIPGL
jgi:hypothetical protein